MLRILEKLSATKLKKNLNVNRTTIRTLKDDDATILDEDILFVLVAFYEVFNGVCEEISCFSFCLHV